MGQLQVGQHPPKGAAPRLAGGRGEAHPQLAGHRSDALARGVVAEQVQVELGLGLLQPELHRRRQLGLAPGQQGAVHIQHQGPDPLAPEGLQGQFGQGAAGEPVGLEQARQTHPSLSRSSSSASIRGWMRSNSSSSTSTPMPSSRRATTKKGSSGM